jgi:hypothetical protein
VCAHRGLTATLAAGIPLGENPLHISNLSRLCSLKAQPEGPDWGLWRSKVLPLSPSPAAAAAPDVRHNRHGQQAARSCSCWPPRVAVCSHTRVWQQGAQSQHHIHPIRAALELKRHMSQCLCPADPAPTSPAGKAYRHQQAPAALPTAKHPIPLTQAPQLPLIGRLPALPRLRQRRINGCCSVLPPTTHSQPAQYCGRVQGTPSCTLSTCAAAVAAAAWPAAAAVGAAVG